MAGTTLREKKGRKRNKRKSSEKLLHRMAMFLYKQACIRGLPLFSSRQVESDLVQLHPGENIQWLKTEYYVKKLTLTLTILLVGILFGAAAKLSAGGKVLLQEDGSITRGSYEEGDLELQVTADLGDDIHEFQVRLQPRLLTEEELDVLAGKFVAGLPQMIKGKNSSLRQVTEDLELLETYEGFPFQVEWESSRPDVLGSRGTVSMADEQMEVELLVKLSYRDYVREEITQVIVVPPVLTPEERLHMELQEYLLVSEEEGRREEKWILPDRWKDYEISWSQKVEDNSMLLWAAALAVAVLVYLFSDKDLHQQLEKRKKLLLREYPDLVHQLALFVGAGMTVRGAFQKIASDYEKKQGGVTGKHPAYEEILYAFRELQSGVSEGAAYEHFGRRAGRQEYIRLSTLLMQNLKRGNSTLLERLREEAEKAGEERLMQSRRLGEEAGTKLLVPMVLMLAVVMVMIMAPAFSAV